MKNERMLAYKFRLYPNKAEQRKLLWAIELCRRAYNRMLEEYNANQPSSIEMGRFLTHLKTEWPELNEVYSKCLQPERDRLYANLASLRELKKRDHSASLVILDRGLKKVRSERPELTLVDTRPLLASAQVQQVGWMKREAPLERAG